MAERDYARFGEQIGLVTKALSECFEEPHVLQALGAPHQTLGGMSPVRMIWENGEEGFEKVMHVIKTRGIIFGPY